MIFQCQDLDRALEFPDLMPEARAHAATCERCREQLDLWEEISRLAPQLHEEWESPDLWLRIRSELARLRRREAAFFARWPLALAAAVIIALFLWKPWSGGQPASRVLLTEQALQEVQRAEAVYARSIEKLSAAAGPSLDRADSPLAAAYREKLRLLDSAIADLKDNIQTNRYNHYLQMQLASLYREKQQTLEEWLKNAPHI